jgi:hypothetical protein
MDLNWLDFLLKWPLFYALALLPAAVPYFVLLATMQAPSPVQFIVRIVFGLPMAVWILGMAPRIATTAARLRSFEFEPLGSSFLIAVFGAPLGLGSLLRERLANWKPWARIISRQSLPSAEQSDPVDPS